MLSWISLRGIAFYQKFISPRKGYRCAYGLLNNTHGCSGAIKAIIKEKGVMAGWGDINSQFTNCKAAAETLREKSGCKKKRKECKGKFKKCKNEACNLPDCVGSRCDVPDFVNCGDCGGDFGSC